MGYFTGLIRVHNDIAVVFAANDTVDHYSYFHAFLIDWNQNYSIGMVLITFEQSQSICKCQWIDL